MRILRLNKLGSSGSKTADESAWETETRLAHWAGAADVKVSHPAAVAKNGNMWEFPLPSDGTTITALVNFGTGDVSIQDVA